jgi:signal transduction histidine kinase
MQVELLLRQVSVDEENAGKVRVLIEKIINDSRTLIFEISPPVLYELGLGSAIEWLAEEIMEHHDIHIEVEDRLEATIEDSIRALIFRSVRELIYNVVKHAEADRAWVGLYHDKSDLKIVIKDNGVGYSPEKDTRTPKSFSGYGLFSIEQRFRQLGGNLEIGPGDDGGTVVTLSLPLALSKGILFEKQVEEA